MAGSVFETLPLKCKCFSAAGAAIEKGEFQLVAPAKISSYVQLLLGLSPLMSNHLIKLSDIPLKLKPAWERSKEALSLRCWSSIPKFLAFVDLSGGDLWKGKPHLVPPASYQKSTSPQGQNSQRTFFLKKWRGVYVCV